ncbi:hypothetical protein BYT27DRAFT_7204213 [Phlegmacium glaucopus]|nr:hypothetical protein BYT27DRAFT_7204213 [Phlegmacium glaucopus]
MFFLPKFKALTEIVEDWRLSQGSRSWLHGTSDACIRVDLQRPIIDNDIHDML